MHRSGIGHTGLGAGLDRPANGGVQCIALPVHPSPAFFLLLDSQGLFTMFFTPLGGGMAGSVLARWLVVDRTSGGRCQQQHIVAEAKYDSLEQKDVWLRFMDLVVFPAQTLSPMSASWPSLQVTQRAAHLRDTETSPFLLPQQLQCSS